MKKGSASSGTQLVSGGWDLGKQWRTAGLFAALWLTATSAPASMGIAAATPRPALDERPQAPQTPVTDSDQTPASRRVFLSRADMTIEEQIQFREWIEQAFAIIRRPLQSPSGRSCNRYFELLGIDLEAWLEPGGGPPFVLVLALERHRRRSWNQVCGGAEGRPPFTHIALNRHCFRRQAACDLASLLLHEMGHLARRDTWDHEPRDFFLRCRLNACVDPGRFR